jgi:hypothetical protein
MRSFQRLSLTVFTMLALVSASQNASSAQNMEDFAREKLAEISAESAQSVPREKIEALWHAIQLDWDSSYLPLKIGHPKTEPSELLRIRLNGVVYDLIERNAIKVLTPEIKAKLALDGLTCRYEGHCTKVDGLYLPVNHIIFIDTSMSDDDLMRVFLHELIHAYQFTYRLPIDIATMSELVQQGKIKSEEVNLYLDYFYESQANWKGLQFSTPLQWLLKVEKQIDQKLQVGVSRLLVSSGVAASTVFIGTGTTAGVGAAVYGLGWLFQIAYGNATANRLLPDLAKSQSLLTINNTPQDKLTAALLLPELVPIDDTMTRYNGFAAYNFDFHRDYGAAVQKYYFGKDRFLFKNDRNDLEIYNELHNHYYKRIGLNSMLESEPACRKLLLKVRDSKISPLVTWLTLPKAELESCSAYRDLGSDDGRERYLDDLLNPQNQKDPFHTGFPGTEGSRPGLTILPQLRVLPIQ